MGPGGNVRIEVERAILQSADEAAAAIRALLSERKIFALNLISSPGSGKTTLIEALLARFDGKGGVAVVEGDIETEIDAERIRKHGVQVRQINTQSVLSHPAVPAPVRPPGDGPVGDPASSRGERGEPRLPRGSPAGGGRPRRPAERDGGGREAAQVPARLQDVRPARDHEDGPVAVRDVRRGPRPPRRARRQPRGGDLRGLRDHRCGDVRPPRPDRGAAGGEERRRCTSSGSPARSSRSRSPRRTGTRRRR